jgi:hypothetical protein
MHALVLEDMHDGMHFQKRKYSTPRTPLCTLQRLKKRKQGVYRRSFSLIRLYSIPHLHSDLRRPASLLLLLLYGQPDPILIVILYLPTQRAPSPLRANSLLCSFSTRCSVLELGPVRWLFSLAPSTMPGMLGQLHAKKKMI